MLSSPNGSGEADRPDSSDRRPDDVVAAASALVPGRFERAPVRAPLGGEPTAWVPVAELLESPRPFNRLVRTAGRARFGSDDSALVAAQVAREAISVLTTVGVHTWATQRRVLDLSAANVLLRESPAGVVVGLRHPDVAVLAGDPLTRPGAPGPAGSVDVLDEDKLRGLLVHRTLGHPQPRGTVPGGLADQVAATATIVATVRRTVRTGHRHLWGSVALALSTALTRASHVVGPRADHDRAALLRARPDLAATLDLVTVPADPDRPAGADITFALRRTCCLLLKLPAGDQCGTCSLRDHDACVGRMTAWARTGRLAASP